MSHEFNFGIDIFIDPFLLCCSEDFGMPIHNIIIIVSSQINMKNESGRWLPSHKKYVQQIHFSHWVNGARGWGVAARAFGLGGRDEEEKKWWMNSATQKKAFKWRGDATRRPFSVHTTERTRWWANWVSGKPAEMRWFPYRQISHHWARLSRSNVCSIQQCWGRENINHRWKVGWQIAVSRRGLRFDVFVVEAGRLTL